MIFPDNTYIIGQQEIRLLYILSYTNQFSLFDIGNFTVWTDFPDHHTVVKCERHTILCSLKVKTKTCREI